MLLDWSHQKSNLPGPEGAWEGGRPASLGRGWGFCNHSLLCGTLTSPETEASWHHQVRPGHPGSTGKEDGMEVPEWVGWPGRWGHRPESGLGGRLWKGRWENGGNGTRTGGISCQRPKPALRRASTPQPGQAWTLKPLHPEGAGVQTQECRFIKQLSCD